jgi:membrane protein required for colicin V production
MSSALPEASAAMSGVDWALVVIVGLSVLLGLVRGVVRELFALLGWILGVVAALRFAEPLGQLLPFELPLGARTVLAGLVIVVAALLLAALTAALLRSILAAARISFEDRVLGGLFGVARGAILVGLVAMVAMAAGGTRQSWWQASTLLPWAQASVRFATPLLPESLARAMPHAMQRSH